jgi:hypothetical protein
VLRQCGLHPGKVQRLAAEAVEEEQSRLLVSKGCCAIVKAIEVLLRVSGDFDSMQ